MKGNNYAFIDGQNLFMGTTKHPSSPWSVDLYRFRVYLERKYGVSKAFYFIGVVDEQNNDLYTTIQDAGFILSFRQHNTAMLSYKKGNVDTDIVFDVMKRLYRNEEFSKIIMVTGDGDYKRLVDFLIEEGRFGKLLFPNQKRSSSLYKNIDVRFKADLDSPGVRAKISR